MTDVSVHAATLRDAVDDATIAADEPYRRVVASAASAASGVALATLGAPAIVRAKKVDGTVDGSLPMRGPALMATTTP